MKLLVLALALHASAHDGLFDGGRGATRLPATVAPRSVPGHAVRPAGTAVPPDLAAASSRVGTAAMLSRIAARPSGQAFAFGVLGDAERGRFWWERIFTPGRTAFPDQWRALQATGPDFVLQLGDFVSEGDADHYREYVSFLDAEVRTPMLHTLGNHDRSRPNGAADKDLYGAVMGPRDYAFDHAGWRFISVDSSDRGLTDAQLDWLERQLAPDMPKVVFTHVPPDYIKSIPPLAEVGELVEWSLDAQEEEEQKGYLRDFFTNYFDVGSPRFETLVSNGGVKAVYMGHIHAFWAADHRGVRYVISGGGGSPLYPLPPGYPKHRFAHALRVEATPAGLRETVMPMNGRPFVLPPVRP
jgi:3',5'-cyclic AMP phosphodiesterase CpdA